MVSTSMPESRPQADSQPRPSPGLPTISELGADILTTTSWQRRWALARPILLVLCFASAWQAGLWWLSPLVMFLLFVAIVTVTHDVVHGAIGLSPRQTDWWLFWLGVILLESGHAYRATHQQHHRVFPGPDDPEGDPAE